MIIWEAMKYAKEKGIKELDMGGLFTDSLNSFKESFGGKRVTYYAYSKNYGLSYNWLPVWATLQIAAPITNISTDFLYRRHIATTTIEEVRS